MIWVLFITFVTINAYNVSEQHAKKLKRIEVVATCFEIDEGDQE